MPIRLNGETSGSVELDVPAAVGSDLQLTLPATAGTALVAPGTTSITVPSVDGTLDRLERAGNVLQVVQGQYSSTSTTNAQTAQDTGLEVTITPTSSSSTILLSTTFFFGQIKDPAMTQDNMKQFTLFRDSTNLAPNGNCFLQHQNQLNSNANFSETTQQAAITYLDSPATTSAITYKLRMFTDSSQSTIHFNTRGHSTSSGTAVILALEVAA